MLFCCAFSMVSCCTASTSLLSCLSTFSSKARAHVYSSCRGKLCCYQAPQAWASAGEQYAMMLLAI